MKNSFNSGELRSRNARTKRSVVRTILSEGNSYGTSVWKLQRATTSYYNVHPKPGGNGEQPGMVGDMVCSVW
jgi:hypothetical protein